MQVKVNGHLGEARHYLVLVGSVGGGAGAVGAKKMSPGPARLHLHEARFALTAGVPPRLLGIWELAHLRYSFFCVQLALYCNQEIITIPVTE